MKIETALQFFVKYPISNLVKQVLSVLQLLHAYGQADGAVLVECCSAALRT